MCPGVAVLAGNGDGGGGSGKGAKNGKGKKGAGTDDGDADAEGDGTNGGEGCGDPVCPISGHVFVDLLDFAFGGPRALRFVRHYSSRKSRVAGELGLGWTHSYGWRVRVRRKTVELLDGGNRLQRFRRPDKGIATNGLGYELTRDGDGFALRGRDGIRRTFGPLSPDGFHHQTSERDVHGNAIVVHRDVRGRLLGFTDSAGRAYRATCDSSGRILAIAVGLDAQGSSWLDVAHYAYDSEGNLSAVTDAEEFVYRYRYQNHLLVEHLTPTGLSYFYRYNGRTADAACIEAWGEYVGRADHALEHPIAPVPPGAPDIRPVKGIYYQRFTYLPQERYSEVENGIGGVRRFFGDDAGRVTKEVTESGTIIEHQFDGRGVEVARSFSDGSETWRSAGFESSDGASVKRHVDADGWEVTVYGKDLSVRRLYDEYGNVIVVEHYDGTREAFEYDPRGLMTQWIDRRGGATVFHLDAMGNCIARVNPMGQVEQYEWDYLGRLRRHLDQSGRETIWAWDRRNEPIYKRTPDGCEYRAEYDANRKLVMMAIADRVTRFEYGGQGWLTRVTEADGTTSEAKYDIHGRRTRVINARGQEFSITLDHAGRCLKWRTFEGVEHEQGFDGADRIAWTSDPLGRIGRGYDAASRLAELTAYDGVEVAFEYGGPGGPTKIASAFPVDRFLDAFGRVLGEKQGRHTLQVNWLAGDVAELAIDTGTSIRIGHNVAGQPARLTIGSASIVRDESVGSDLVSSLGADLVLRKRYGLGGELLFRGLARRTPGVSSEELGLANVDGTLRWTAYQYNARRELVAEHHSDGSVITYELSATGQVLRRTAWLKQQIIEDERLGYDSAGSVRVVGATYDGDGRPTQFNGETFEYDALGRLIVRTTDDGEWRYTWNSLDQLIQVDAPTHVVELLYDARGRRMQKRVLREGELVRSVSYVWNNNLVVQEVDDLQASTRTYFRTNDEWDTFGHVDRAGDDCRPVYYVLSGIGGCDYAVDERGRVVFDGARTTYGHVRPTVTDVEVSARFPNQFYDADVELAYTRHRWYDARLGVFVTTDPVFLEGNFNPRDYVHNPLQYIDPTGWHAGPGSGAGNMLPAGAPGSSSHYPSPGSVPGAPPALPGAPTSPPGGLTAMGPGYMSGPGHWATPGHPGGPPGSVPCPPAFLAPGTSTPAATQAAVDLAGNAYGCHGCGAKSPGTSSGHWVADHQPPRSTYGAAAAAGGQAPSPATVRLYPHCISCSRMQGGQMSHHAGSLGTGAANVMNLHNPGGV